MNGRVGFVGLGAMGLPMARCVARAGFELTVLDIVDERMGVLAAEFPAVVKAGGLSELGRSCDTVITMLPEAKTVAKVCRGGLFDAMRSGSVWIDMTTGDPFLTGELAEEAAQRGIHTIDAPCGRSPAHASRGELLALVGADEEVLELVRPLLSTMASDVIRCGGVGAGHTMKLINNLLSGVIQEANIEAISLGMKAGISVNTMLEVFSKVCVWNGYLAALPYEEESAPGWKVSTAEEHMELVQKLGRKYDVPIYTPSVVRARMQEMMARGLGDAKYSNITTLMKHMAGMEICEKIVAPEIGEH